MLLPGQVTLKNESRRSRRYRETSKDTIGMNSLRVGPLVALFLGLGDLSVNPYRLCLGFLKIIPAQ